MLWTFPDREKNSSEVRLDHPFNPYLDTTEQIYLFDNHNLLLLSFFLEVSFTRDLWNPTVIVLYHNFAVDYPGLLCFFISSGHARSGGRLNKKDGLTRYGDSHVKDKTS